MKEVIRMTKDLPDFSSCNAMEFHAYMESWGMAVDNPYFAIRRVGLPLTTQGDYR